jgi:hypothetical protein
MANDSDDDFPPDVVRAPEEVARRTLVVFAVSGLALGAPRSEVVEWLSDEKLMAELTPSERRFVDNPTPSEKEKVNAGWLCERVTVLCWALCLIDELPAPDEQCGTAELQDILPPFVDVEVADFIKNAALRPDPELIEMADTMLNQHWEARNSKLKGTAPRFPVDIEIVQERHHAINWVIGYNGGVDWDDVTTDT